MSFEEQPFWHLSPGGFRAHYTSQFCSRAFDPDMESPNIPTPWPLWLVQGQTRKPKLDKSSPENILGPPRFLIYPLFSGIIKLAGYVCAWGLKRVQTWFKFGESSTWQMSNHMMKVPKFSTSQFIYENVTLPFQLAVGYLPRSLQTDTAVLLWLLSYFSVVLVSSHPYSSYSLEEASGDTSQPCFSFHRAVIKNKVQTIITSHLRQQLKSHTW